MLKLAKFQQTGMIGQLVAPTVEFVASAGPRAIIEVIWGFETQLSIPAMYSARMVNGCLLN